MNKIFFLLDLKTVPPGFSSGMNFGSADVNLSLASTLKTKLRETGHSLATNEPTAEDVIDLGNLLKEKSTIFQWISEEKPPAEEEQSES